MLFEREFGAKALQIAPYHGPGQLSPVQPIADGAVASRKRAHEFSLVPSFGMPTQARLKSYCSVQKNGT